MYFICYRSDIRLLFVFLGNIQFFIRQLPIFINVYITSRFDKQYEKVCKGYTLINVKGNFSKRFQILFVEF